MLRALFLTVYPTEAAATRFRIAQFFPFLERNGVSCTLGALLSADDFRRLYSSRPMPLKAAGVLAGSLRQTARALAARRYDVAFVQRGALLAGPPLLEALIARVARVPLVYDYDDAIWMHDPASPGGWLTRLAKYPAKVGQIIRMARHVIVCNEYTRSYALRYRRAADVTVIPTVVDDDVYRPDVRRRADGVTVGWIGTHSTAQYLARITGPLREVAARHPFTLKIVGSGRNWDIPGVRVVSSPWSLADEVADYQSLDVGLYPVADDEWGHGKTGFKPVVYMSSGAVCVASPVGGVTEFIRDGENGLLASTAADWVRALSALLVYGELRARLAAAGRRTVEEQYCLRVQAPRLLEVLRAAAS